MRWHFLPLTARQVFFAINSLFLLLCTFAAAVGLQSTSDSMWWRQPALRDMLRSLLYQLATLPPSFDIDGVYFYSRWMHF